LGKVILHSSAVKSILKKVLKRQEKKHSMVSCKNVCARGWKRDGEKEWPWQSEIVIYLSRIGTSVCHKNLLVALQFSLACSPLDVTHIPAFLSFDGMSRDMRIAYRDLSC
jgi:hypothetical protein